MDGDAGAPVDGRRIAVLLEYDGTAYSGSQYQENGPSIQSELEAAIRKLTSETVRAAFAGRTDAGVHALGQVASFETVSRLTPAEFVSGLNHFLPEDIAVRAAKEVAREFDPRRHAPGRLYRYRIDNRAVRSPLERNRSWHVARPLDVAAMQRAARLLEGKHDFAAFAGPYDGLHGADAAAVRSDRVRRARDGGDGGAGLPPAPGAPDGGTAGRAGARPDRREDADGVAR